MDCKNEDDYYICHICQKQFKHLHRLKSHLNRKNACVSQKNFQENAEFDNSINCEYCNKKFAKKGNLSRHLKNQRCNKMSSEYDYNDKIDSYNVDFEITFDLTEKVTTLENQLAEKNEQMAKLIENSVPASFVLENMVKMQQEIAELKEKPKIINNNLQIMCIGQNDNYLDMLTEELNDFNKALEYVKSCALSSLTGDCKLIERIYLNNQPNSIKYINKGKTKIQYFDENNNKIIDTRVQFGKKLANNLQNSYLKGINHLINDNLDNNRCPNQFLENYDLQTWNQHIYELSNVTYHKKIVNNLNIQSI